MNDNLVITPQGNDLPKMNVFQRIFSTIFSPEKVMADLEQKPRVLLGIILTILVPMISMFGAFPMFKEYSRGTLEITYANMGIQLTPEKFEQALNGATISGPIIAGIIAGVMLLVEALAVWLVMKIFKGKAGFKKVLSVLGYSSVISVLSAIVAVVVINITGTYTDVTYTSLASFLPNLKGSFLFGITREVDVFVIWQMVVSAIGIAVVSKVDKKKAYLVMAILFVITAAYLGYNEVAAAKLLN